ncbi:DUF2510 domain-containing protein [Nocardioides ungokensis]|uniref:DUF2510 domain-containing protein n=1 Tax=Nocardioides ungokensis TaxID=1643322 RepID=UPI0015E0307E|nr:DUF2510 domain-containing protein [Nocardioides ungokensis]
MDQYLKNQDAEEAAQQTAEQTSQTGSSTMRHVPAGWYPDPVMASTRRYWDGAAWTEHIVPADDPAARETVGAIAESVPDPAPAEAAGVGRPRLDSSVNDSAGRDDATFAWVLACLPLAWIAIDYAAPQVTAQRWFWVVGWIVAGALASADAKRLDARGVEAPGWFWAAFLQPVYLIRRSTLARSTPLLPIVWFVTFGAFIFAAYTFNNTWEFNGGTEGFRIESQLEQRGINSNVSCPSDWLSKGETVNCTVHVRGYGTSILKVTAGADGAYTWRVIP